MLQKGDFRRSKKSIRSFSLTVLIGAFIVLSLFFSVPALAVPPSNFSDVRLYYGTEGVTVQSSENENLTTPDASIARHNASSHPAPAEVPPVTNQDRNGLIYGQRIYLAPGTKYWSSPDHGGIQPYGTIGNRYTPIGCDIYISGFSLSDQTERLGKFRAYRPSQVPVGEEHLDGIADKLWDYAWVSFYVDDQTENIIGWVPASAIQVINGVQGDSGSNARFANGITIITPDDVARVPELESSSDSSDLGSKPTPEEYTLERPEILDDRYDPQAEDLDIILGDPGNMLEDRVIADRDRLEPKSEGEDSDNLSDSVSDPWISTREIAYAIEDYAENGERVALLLDASSSVESYMTEIAEYARYAEQVNKADTILVFAETFQKISVEEYSTTDVGETTNIFEPLNSLSAADYDRIIIVTDSYHNTESARLVAQSDFTGKIIVVSPLSLRRIFKSTIKTIDEAWQTETYLCLLDNELDRLRFREAVQDVASANSNSDSSTSEPFHR